MERKLKLRQIAVIGCGESIPGRPSGLKIQPGGKYILYDKDAWKARAALER